MKFESYGSSNVGKSRHRNEDAFLDDPPHLLYAVADGLGGLAGGDRASQLAISILKAHQQEALKRKRPIDLRQVFIDSHKAIQKLGAQLDPIRGAGTTLTAVRVEGDQILLAHAGDSAAYMRISGDWQKLTTDHTEAEDMRQNRPGEIIPPIFEHTLTRCLGQPGSVEPDLLTRPCNAGDRLFLCTDGITRDIQPEEIGKWIEQHRTPRELVKEVIKLANRRGGGDNLTALAIFID